MVGNFIRFIGTVSQFCRLGVQNYFTSIFLVVPSEKRMMFKPLCRAGMRWPEML